MSMNSIELKDKLVKVIEDLETAVKNKANVSIINALEKFEKLDLTNLDEIPEAFELLKRWDNAFDSI